jgi:8-oxo-dGTP diphosphatase
VSRLRFTTLVEAPLTVAFDVARALGRPWPVPLEEVVSVRPFRDVYAVGPGRGWRRLTHSRRFTATGAGTLVEEQVDWATALPGPLGRVVDPLLRRRVRRAMRAHLDGYAAAAARRALDVVQVVGAALVDGDRVLVAQRSGGPYDGCWEFPGGKVEPGRRSSPRWSARSVRSSAWPSSRRRSSGRWCWTASSPAGCPGPPRCGCGRPACRPGSEVTAHEHSELRWLTADELESLDWIPADRPLLPAVRALLGRR